jgi:hypothetical protein
MKKTGVTAPAFFSCVVSVLLHVAVGIEIAVRVVSRVVQVPHVSVVSTEGIGGSGTLGNRSAGVVGVVVRDVVMVAD